MLLCAITGRAPSSCRRLSISHTSRRRSSGQALASAGTSSRWSPFWCAITAKPSPSRTTVSTALWLPPNGCACGNWLPCCVGDGSALELLKAWNTGHPGGVATVHANNARAGLARLENLVAEATAAPMQKTIAAAINLIVSISKSKATPSGRKVEEIVRVLDFENGAYLTKEDQ